MNTILSRVQSADLDVRKLLMRCLKRWWLILICGAVGAACAFLYTQYFITPLYRASVTIYVNNSSKTESVDYVSGSSLSVSARLVSTYVNIITSDTVLEQVGDALGDPSYTPSRLRSMMSASQVDDTEIFQVSVSCSNPEKAAEIANVIADVAPGEIQNILDGSSTKIIDRAVVPSSPYSPNVSRNVMMGFAVGAAAMLCVIGVFWLTDVRVKDEEELSEMFELPILGLIPSISPRDGERSDKETSAYG